MSSVVGNSDNPLILSQRALQKQYTPELLCIPLSLCDMTSVV